MLFLNVLPIEEISLSPELSSQSGFRFQGGYPEHDKVLSLKDQNLCA